MEAFCKQVTVLWHQRFLFYLLKFKYHRKVGVDRICQQHKQVYESRLEMKPFLHNGEIKAKQQKKSTIYSTLKVSNKQAEQRFQSTFGHALLQATC